MVQWNLALTIGSYLLPFGFSSADYTPFTFNKTTAGVGGTSFSFSSYRTFNSQNLPYPPTVSGLLGGGDSNGSGVGDRFWIISPSGYTTNPTANITFTIANAERVAGNPNLNAQRWNASGYWDPAFPACGTGTCTTGSTSNAVTVNAVNNFSPWAVTDNATPLPIELVDFTVQLKSGLVAVAWKTESELNNDFFTVEKTMDGEAFDDVVKVKGAGTTSQSRTYSILDYGTAPGKWYYRLRQTDFDGKISFSKLVAVDVPDYLSWKVYPNPSNGSEFSIGLSSDDVGKTAYITVQDLNGKEMFQIETKNLTSTHLKIEVPQKLSSGLYIVSLGIEQRVVRLKLIVRE